MVIRQAQFWTSGLCHNTLTFMVHSHADYPDCASAPRFAMEVQNDADAQAESLSAFDQSYMQMEAGAFEGTMATCDFGTGLVVSFETVNRRIMQLGEIPEGSVQVAMILDDDEPSKFKCSPLPKHSAVLMKPGCEALLHAGRGMKICLLSVTEGAVENLKQRYDFDPDVLSDDVILPGHQTKSLRGLVVEAYDRFSVLPNDGAVSEREIRSFQNAILGTIAWSFGTPDSSELDRSTPIRHSAVFSEALALIDGHLDDEISPDWIASSLSVSRRTLDTIFSSATGASPAQFIKLRRLNRLRALLSDPKLANETIGELAAECGFWHLSRLASEYRDQFGLLPSRDREQMHSML